MESLMWVMALIPVICLGSLRTIGWLTGGMALIVAMACPQAMATIGVLGSAGVMLALSVIMTGKLCER